MTLLRFNEISFCKTPLSAKPSAIAAVNTHLVVQHPDNRTCSHSYNIYNIAAFTLHLKNPTWGFSQACMEDWWILERIGMECADFLAFKKSTPFDYIVSWQSLVGPHLIIYVASNGLHDHCNLQQQILIQQIKLIGQKPLLESNWCNHLSSQTNLLPTTLHKWAMNKDMLLCLTCRSIKNTNIIDLNSFLK